MGESQRTILVAGLCLPACLRQGFFVGCYCAYQDSRPMYFWEFSHLCFSPPCKLCWDYRHGQSQLALCMILGFELRSSFLCGKCLTHWSIFLPQILFSMNISNSLDSVFLQEPFSTVFVILQDVLIAELQGAIFTAVLSDWYPPELGSKSQMYFFCLFVCFHIATSLAKWSCQRMQRRDDLETRGKC